MKLIDKDALVAEIIRRRKAIPKDEDDTRLQAVYGNEAFVLTQLLEYIDTLEVKEVDLDLKHRKENNMTKDEAIKYLQQLYPNGVHCWLDEQRIEAIGMAVKALQEEPVSEDLEGAAQEYVTKEGYLAGLHYNSMVRSFKAGAEWYVSHNTKLPDNLLLAARKASIDMCNIDDKHLDEYPYHPIAEQKFIEGAQWQKQQMIANTADAMIGLPYENKDGGYTHLIDVSRPLPVGRNKIAIIFKED